MHAESAPRPDPVYDDGAVIIAAMHALWGAPEVHALLRDASVEFESSLQKVLQVDQAQLRERVLARVAARP